MNLFVLDENPVTAANYLCDKHIVKMQLECAQLLCAVSWMNKVPAPYKLTHKNHPVLLWTAETLSNYNWVLEHGIAISKEYSRRYNKVHSCLEVLEWCKDSGGKPKEGKLTTFCQTMPDEYKRGNAVDAYRAYYIGEKLKFAKWNHSNIPSIFTSK